jgi:hypothetical protein
VEQAHIDTILNLALDGRLPDPTNGARYFQNPTIVASRATAGTVSPGVVNFGGRTPVAVIKDHAFYDVRGGGRRLDPAPSLFVPTRTASDSVGAKLPAADPSQPSSLFVPLSR